MNYLLDTVILMCAAVLLVPLFQYFRLGAVLGFLVAGALVGPSGLAFIDNVEELRHFSELGVVFLLFIIGVELKPSRLWHMRRNVFGLGSLQVVVTAALIVPLALMADFSMPKAILIGLALALSSTAFVLQILAERRELNTTVGRQAFSVLLLQDLAVVPLLALVPLLAQPDTSVGSNLGLAIAESGLILMLVYLVGRFLLRPVLHVISIHGTPEIFAAMALLIVLGAALSMEEAGLSMAMGAFIAGLLIADSEYRHQILADIQPFRGFLLGLFFMAVGMSVNIGLLATEPGKILLALLLLVGIKFVVMVVLGRIFGMSIRDSLRAALFLGQSGEFGFVLFGVAVGAGLLDQDEFALLALVIALSMAITPLLALLANYLKTSPTLDEETEETPLNEQLESKEEEQAQVVVAGCGRVGRRILRILTQADMPCVAIDRNPELVNQAREEGLNVYYGDASRVDVLKAAVEHRPLMVIITLDAIEDTARVVEYLRLAYPDLPIYARAHDQSSCERLHKLGATNVVSENLEASLQLARMALQWQTAFEGQEQLLSNYREDYYAGRLGAVKRDDAT